MNATAQLYRIPSGFENIPDKIIIRARPKNSYPGTWRSAKLSLPDGFSVCETEYGDGFITSDTGEDIFEVYPASGEKIDGNAISGTVLLHDNRGCVIARCPVKWY